MSDTDEPTIFLSLLLVEGELVKSKQKLEAQAPDLAALLQAIGKEIGANADDLVLSNAKLDELAEVTDLEQLGSKAKVQVWSRAGFDKEMASESPPTSPTAAGADAGPSLSLDLSEASAVNQMIDGSTWLRAYDAEKRRRRLWPGAERSQPSTKAMP